MARALRGSGYKVTVDLESLTVTDDQGLSAKFDVDPFRKNSLLEGLDDVGITLTLGEAIDSFEEKRTARW
jgi:3-isopropylmalate/(R)-2-methylmalate dehydratase small subunit